MEKPSNEAFLSRYQARLLQKRFDESLHSFRCIHVKEMAGTGNFGVFQLREQCPGLRQIETWRGRTDV